MLYPLHVTGVDALTVYEKEEEDTVVYYMLCAILYLLNSDKDSLCWPKEVCQEQLCVEQGVIPEDCYCGTEPTIKLST